MCRSKKVTEDNADGSNFHNSVVLRVLEQQDGCVCRITVEYNHNPPAYIKIEHNENHIESKNCGLEINMKSYNNGSEMTLEPIGCHRNNERNITVNDMQYIDLTSKQKNDSFPVGLSTYI